MGAVSHNRLIMLIRNRKGIAVITVISIVGVALLMAVAYLIGSRFESRVAYLFLSRVKARYVAESMAQVAVAMIKNDENRGIDGVDDEFVKFFSGSDVDVDGDGQVDSRWVYLSDDMRAAVKVVDESGKANLNCPFCHNQRVFEALVNRGELSKNYLKAWDYVLDYLKGPDGKWGKAGMDDDGDNYYLEKNGKDDDGDGEVDEIGEGVDDPGEFLFGDDRKLDTVEDLRRVFDWEITPKEMVVLHRYFTTYSHSPDLDGLGEPKVNLNFLSPEELVNELLVAGVSNPWAKAVNIRDFCDKDLARSELYGQSYAYRPYVWEGAPDWYSKGTVLVNSTPSDEWERWEWSGLAPGNYYCYFYGEKDGDYVGDVMANGVQGQDISSGEGLAGKAVYIGNDGKLEVKIRFRPNSGKNKAVFSRVELVPVNSSVGGNKVISGIEAVRITEVYAHPKLSLSVSSASLVHSGSWAGGENLFYNSDAGSGRKGRGTWEFGGIPNGVYYVQVWGRNDKDVVGDVDLGWAKEEHMRSGQWLSSPVRVYDGTLRISIENNESEGTTCYFRSIVLSQEPDAEFVEICNISDKEINIGGWSLSVDGKEVFPAFVPMGVKLGPKECKVLSVDGFDTTSGVAGNGLSISSLYPDLLRSQIVSLDFPVTMQPGMDVLPDSDVLELKDENGAVVDGVDLAPCDSFASIYRSPLDNTDSNHNGNFDGWSSPKEGDPLATPGICDMEGIKFANGPIDSMADLFEVSDGEGGKLSPEDVARVWARMDPWGPVFLPIKYRVSGWQVVGTGLMSGGEGDVLELHFPPDEIEDGYYRLILWLNPRCEVGVSIYSEGQWPPMSSSLWADDSGFIDLNWVKIEGGLKLRIQSRSHPVYLYGVSFSPNYSISGRINVNTATDLSMLSAGLSLPVAQRIVHTRPFSDFLGVGNLVNLIPEDELRLSDRFLSVNSDSYSIAVIGQVLKRGKVKGESRIWVGLDRK